MKEGLHKAEDMIPGFRQFEGDGKYVVIHSHIGSKFDKKLQNAMHQGRRDFKFETTTGDKFHLGFVYKETLDSSKHKVVRGSARGLNQADNVICRVQED